ncbi:MAG: hypothetical protein HZT41_02675 [Dechloromonas sp.]|jgi:hypothetical protein|nr:MAG: hypothetical protein HZT41_02675 [Dechloromonas sp.]
MTRNRQILPGKCPAGETSVGNLGLAGSEIPPLMEGQVDAAWLSRAIVEPCPDGIHCHPEDVGDMVVDAVLTRVSAQGRIALCGMIASYDGQPPPPAQPAMILVNRRKLQGFIISDRMDIWPQALTEFAGLVVTGKQLVRPIGPMSNADLLPDHGRR